MWRAAKREAGRNSAGFNPARREDIRFFAAVLDGDHIARGFRNKDIRVALFGTHAKTTRRELARTRSRLISKLLRKLQRSSEVRNKISLRTGELATRRDHRNKWQASAVWTVSLRCQSQRLIVSQCGLQEALEQLQVECRRRLRLRMPLHAHGEPIGVR